jgi:hypothetical protein
MGLNLVNMMTTSQGHQVQSSDEEAAHEFLSHYMCKMWETSTMLEVR